MCGGEPSEVVLSGQAPARPPAIAFDPAYVHALTGLSIGREGTLEILKHLGFGLESGGAVVTVQPPSWRRDVEGKADLVEEVARIAGFAALPSTPLPAAPPAPEGVLAPVQKRAATARRTLAAMGYLEAVTWSFMPKALAERFGGGDERLVLDNPIAAELDCMRPSILPNLIQAAARNAARGFPDAALFEAGPVYLGPRAEDQRTVVAAVLSASAPRRWDGAKADRLFELKGDLMALLEELGAPTAALQWAQGQSRPWWHPGRSARLQLGPKVLAAEIGELHPAILQAMDAEGPLYGFELVLDALPEPKRKATKTKAAVDLSPLMPVRRDFAFVADAGLAAGDLVRAAASADKALIAEARVFDRYEGPGVPEGKVSLAVEVVLQPREKTLTDAEIEAVAAKVVQAAEKLGARLRG
jgi:phenylalanyl-tRNA synthetase beta chain